MPGPQCLLGTLTGMESFWERALRACSRHLSTNCLCSFRITGCWGVEMSRVSRLILAVIPMVTVALTGCKDLILHNTRSLLLPEFQRSETELHLSYNIRPRFWVSVDGNYWRGGETSLNGKATPTTLQANSRLGTTASIPITKHQPSKSVIAVVPTSPSAEISRMSKPPGSTPGSANRN